MVFELVKNSLRAVQERYVDSDKVAPPIRIIVADGIEDVTIKVLVVVLHTFMKSSVVVKLCDEVSFFTSHLQGKAKKKGTPPPPLLHLFFFFLITLKFHFQ